MVCTKLLIWAWFDQGIAVKHWLVGSTLPEKSWMCPLGTCWMPFGSKPCRDTRPRMYVCCALLHPGHMLMSCNCIAYTETHRDMYSWILYVTHIIWHMRISSTCVYISRYVSYTSRGTRFCPCQIRGKIRGFASAGLALRCRQSDEDVRSMKWSVLSYRIIWSFNGYTVAILWYCNYVIILNWSWPEGLDDLHNEIIILKRVNICGHDFAAIILSYASFVARKWTGRHRVPGNRTGDVLAS